MFAFGSLLTNFFKKSPNVTNLVKTASFSTCTPTLWMRVTPTLFGAPMKKKKKADPQMEKMRIEKKRKRLWRECRRIMKLEKQLKPLEELEIPYNLVDDREKYLRERNPISVEKLEERGDLLRAWTAYRTEQHAQNLQLIDRVEYAQHRALEQLLKESPELYRKAIQIDESFLPFMAKGTARSPPIKDYFNPDGDYVDSTKKWDPVIIPDKKELKKMGITIVHEENEEWKKKKEKKEKKTRR